jgi:hypothetical protein
MTSERYFSSGNERTHFRIDYAGEATNAGYHVKATDTMAFIVDLMNVSFRSALRMRTDDDCR